MRFFILILLIFQISYGRFSYAEQIITNQNNFACYKNTLPLKITNDEKFISQICYKTLSEKNLPIVTNNFQIDDILPMIGGCAHGTFHTLKTQLKGYAYFVSLFVKDIPLYLYNKAHDLFNDQNSAISTVDKLTNENISIIDKANRLAKQYMALMKDFLVQTRAVLKKDYAAFFCYPKHIQAKILCELVSTVFMIFYSPSDLIQNVSYIKNLPKLLRHGVNFVINTGPTIGNQAARIKATSPHQNP